MTTAPTPGPATPDRTWSDLGPEYTDNRTALLDRGYAVTVPVSETGHCYGVRVEDLSGDGDGDGDGFTAPVFRVLPGKQWLLIAPGPELDALAADLRDRFAVEAVLTRDYVAQFPGGW
jgi:hypothetical protein